MQTEEYDKIIKDRIKNYLRIIVSENCNLNCVYCHHEGRVGSLIGSEVKDNPQFNLKMLLEKAKKMNFTKIKISGGEPLLYPNILQICHEFQNDFVDIGFTSNGTMINDLVKDFEKIRNSKLTFNITLNALDPNKYKEITGKDSLNSVKEGIEYLVESGFNVKINAVITSFNIDEIVNLISYAARLKINIKLLDLFTVDDIPNSFKHVSIPEIKNRIIKLFRLEESDFRRINDYLVANVMGIEVMIPSRVYSADCQHNCQMYPCAEGIFGIRVYEDYSCAKCFVGPIYQGGIEQFELNINKIRKELGSFRFSY